MVVRTQIMTFDCGLKASGHMTHQHIRRLRE